MIMMIVSVATGIGLQQDWKKISDLMGISLFRVTTNLEVAGSNFKKKTRTLSHGQ
jgi:hypothetical protein